MQRAQMANNSSSIRRLGKSKSILFGPRENITGILAQTSNGHLRVAGAKLDGGITDLGRHDTSKYVDVYAVL